MLSRRRLSSLPLIATLSFHTKDILMIATEWFSRVLSKALTGGRHGLFSMRIRFRVLLTHFVCGMRMTDFESGKMMQRKKTYVLLLMTVEKHSVKHAEMQHCKNI